MASIKMDPAEMTAKANSLDKKGQEFHTVVTDIGKLVMQMCSAWDGSASDAFAEQYTRLEPGFVKTEELIQDLAQQVRDICKIITEADDDIAKKLKK